MRDITGASTSTTSTLTSDASRVVIGRFPAGAPRGSWPAEEYAARLTREGRPTTVVMDLATDAFLVIDDAKAVAA